MGPILTIISISILAVFGAVTGCVALVAVILARRVYLTDLCGFPGFWFARATNM